LKNPAVRSGLPDLPHLAYKRGARLERHLSRLPAGRRHFARCADVLKRLDLPDQLVGVASHFGREDLHRADDEIGINDESPANVHAGILVVHTIDGADFAATIR
jgi:hypothetical protein